MGRGNGFLDERICVATVLLLVLVLPIGASELEKWLIMPGDVTSAHAQIEADCGLCHSPLSDVSQVELCIDCHTEIGNDVELGLGLHGELAKTGNVECSDCHTDHEGRDMRITALDESTFDHSMTDFDLHGLHLGVACIDCHADGTSYRDAPSECASCHNDDDVHGQGLDIECGACHIAGGWQFARFEHTTTGFPLAGAHRALTCDACHATKDFSGAGNQCIDCHREDDVHGGRNGSQCAECHNDRAWDRVAFDHLSFTGFGLIGGHAGLECADCHRLPDHSGLGGSTCQSCHAGDDVHQGRFGLMCGSCHEVSDWGRARFDHARQAGFTLPAGHDALSCDSCHAGKLTDPVPADCAGCHQDDDPHLGQLGNDCESCHVASNWVAQLWFDHDLTSFPLLGAHSDVVCASCHETAAFHDAETDCASCHSDQDPHKGSLGDDCGSCHNASGWPSWTFDHSTLTTFPLTGMHAGLDCSSCHVDETQSPGDLSADCNACHRRDDPHNGRFGNNCENCHSTSTFLRVEGL